MNTILWGLHLGPLNFGGNLDVLRRGNQDLNRVRHTGWVGFFSFLLFELTSFFSFFFFFFFFLVQRCLSQNKQPRKSLGYPSRPAHIFSEFKPETTSITHSIQNNYFFFKKMAPMSYSTWSTAPSNTDVLLPRFFFFIGLLPSCGEDKLVSNFAAQDRPSDRPKGLVDP
jgi:hypothetical protein